MPRILILLFNYKHLFDVFANTKRAHQIKFKLIYGDFLTELYAKFNIKYLYDLLKLNF